MTVPFIDVGKLGYMTGLRKWSRFNVLLIGVGAQFMC
jgi:hypothetical protein